jgi:cell division septation protein DedD
MAMSNRQVIAIFIIGIVLLLGAFWAGLYVVKQDTGASSNQAGGPSNQNAQSGHTPKQAATNAQAAGQQPESEAGYVVQVGSAFGTVAEANKFMSELRQKYPSAYTQNPGSQDTLYRVRIGPYKTREEAQQAGNELASQGFKGVMIFPFNQK